MNCRKIENELDRNKRCAQVTEILASYTGGKWQQKRSQIDEILKNCEMFEDKALLELSKAFGERQRETMTGLEKKKKKMGVGLK